MLNKHLKANCRPVAAQENLVFWKDYRVTVLGERLFRVERSAEKKFNDCATQGVWFRDMPAQKFTVKETGGSLTVDTGAVRLVLREPFEKSRIVVDGVARKIGNAGNLLGTYRTLDGCDGARFEGDNRDITLGTGVCSKTGVAVLDDGDTLLLLENGELLPRKAVFDKYIFAFGKDYRGAVNALYQIEGAVPMLPRFALGNWWSRYYEYSEKSYLQLLNRFEENDVPLTVATIDMDWHYSIHLDEQKKITELHRNSEEFGGNNGWTGYSWNKELFPDYKGFLKKIQEKNLKITLNLHPADGVRWWEDMYEEFATALGYDATTLAPVKFNLGSTEFINKYFEILHKPYEADGVEFWWIDWQQGVSSDVEGLDPLWALNHYHYLDSAVNHDVPLILSRYCGAGAHRYPLGFTGDTAITWNTLRYLPYFTLTASNVGYTWWSHDIGGHHQGAQDEELYVRSLQFGCFNPINRLHSTCYPTVTKEPWFYPNGCGALAAEILRFRHKLIPFLYSAAYRTHTEGVALVEPLYYSYPERKEAYRFKNEYFFGGLLVAPVTTKGGKDGYARVKVWLPEGRWTDLFTGEIYEGEKVVEMYRSLESIPVLAKEGTILPLTDRIHGNGCPLPETLRVKIYRGNGGYTLYEDAGKKQAFTQFDLKSKAGELVLTVKVTGDKGVIPAKRALKLEFVDIGDAIVEVAENGAPCAFREIVADNVTCLIKNVGIGKEYTVRVGFVEKTKLEELKENAERVLKRANGDNNEKRNLYIKLDEVKTVEAFKAAVEEGKVSVITKIKLLEML